MIILYFHADSSSEDKDLLPYSWPYRHKKLNYDYEK